MITTKTSNDAVRSVRLGCEIRIHASLERVFQTITEESASWFPHSYGGDRTRRIVVEPKVGGLHYEDWGDGNGHLYGHVTVYDASRALALRRPDHARHDPRHGLPLRARRRRCRGPGRKVAVGPMTANFGKPVDSVPSGAAVLPQSAMWVRGVWHDGAIPQPTREGPTRWRRFTRAAGWRT